MRFTLLDAASWRWLPILGITAFLLTVCAFIYDKRFGGKGTVNTISMSLLTGSAFSVLFLLGALVFDTLQYLNYSIIGNWLGIYNPKKVLVLESSTASLPALGLCYGLLIGAGYSLSYEFRKQLFWFRKYSAIIVLTTLLVSMGIAILSKMLNLSLITSTHPLIFVALICAYIAGFLAGFQIEVFIQRQNRYQLALIWFIGTFFSLGVALLIYWLTNAELEQFFQALAFTGEISLSGFLIGFLIGPVKTEQVRVTWRSLLFWLAGSLVVGSIVCYGLAHAHLGLYASIGGFIFLSTLIPSILLGRGNQIISQKKPKIIGTSKKDIFARVYWSKLFSGCLLGMLYTFVISFFNVQYAYLFSPSESDTGAAIYYLFESIAASLHYGLFIGGILGFGPLIHYFIHIMNKRLLLVTLVLVVLGAFFQAIPSIIDLWKP